MPINKMISIIAMVKGRVINRKGQRRARAGGGYTPKMFETFGLIFVIFRDSRKNFNMAAALPNFPEDHNCKPTLRAGLL